MFAKLLAERKVERTPMLTVIKQHPKEILLSAFARMAEQAPFYIFTAFVFSYGIGTLHVSRDFLLTAVLVGLRAVVCLDTAVRSSVRPHRPQEHVHDRRGGDRRIRLRLFRDAQHRIGNGDLPRDHPVAHSARHDVRSAGGADRRKLHRPRLRYSGSSLGYQLASVIAGGPAPLIATWLYGTYHSATAIAVYIAICAVITLVATALMTDYTGKDINAEGAHQRRT